MTCICPVFACLFPPFFFFLKFSKFSTSLIPWGKFRSPYLGKATAAARAALPIPNSACSIFMRPSKGMVANALDLEHMRTDGNACDCTWGLCRHHKRVCTESWLGGKSFAAPWTQTCLGGVPVQHSANWAISLPSAFSLPCVNPETILSGWLGSKRQLTKNCPM